MPSPTGNTGSGTLLKAATAFVEAAEEVFDMVEEGKEQGVAPVERVKGLGALIKLKSSIFERFGVSGAAFAEARTSLPNDPDVKMSLGMLERLEMRWSSIVDAIEAETAELENAQPKIRKGEAVPDLCLPTSTGGTWRLSKELERGSHVLLVVLRHFG